MLTFGHPKIVEAERNGGKHKEKAL